MALGMNGEELPRDQRVSSFAVNEYESEGAGVGVINDLNRLRAIKVDKPGVRPLTAGNVLKSTSTINRAEQLVIVTRQKRLRSNGRLSRVSNILAKRDVCSIGSRSVISTI